MVTTIDQKQDPQPTLVDPPPYGSLARKKILASIALNEVALKDLLACKDELQRRMDETQALISHERTLICPIRCLPTEMLSRVLSSVNPPILPMGSHEIINY